MSWRFTQMGANLCKQDKIILDLFGNDPVAYYGVDPDFSKLLNIDYNANNLLLTFNTRIWCSEIVQKLQARLRNPVEKFYIGINRYCILGNDTHRQLSVSNNYGADIIAFVSTVVAEQGFVVTKSGMFDQDKGQLFNFVQPLTWIYGTNQSN